MTKQKRLFNSVEFGYSVFKKMLKLDLSFRQLQDEIGVDQATIHRVTTGKPPNVETYLRLDKWLKETNTNAKHK